MCAHTHTHAHLTPFVLSCLKMETLCSFISKYINVFLLRNKDILLHNYSAVIKIRKWVFIYYHYPTCKPYFTLVNCPNYALYRKRKSQVICYVRLLSPFNLKEFFVLSLCVMTLAYPKSVGHFVNCPTFGFFWGSLMIRFGVLPFGRECQGRDVVFSVYPLRRHMMSICVIFGYVIFGHVVKMVCARFPPTSPPKVSIFSCN